MGAPPSAPRATAAALRDVARVAGAGPGRSPGAGRGMHARPHCLPRARWHCTAAAPAVSDVQDSAGRGKRRGPPPGRRAACALSECTPTCSFARAARACVFVCVLGLSTSSAAFWLPGALLTSVRGPAALIRFQRAYWCRRWIRLLLRSSAHPLSPRPGLTRGRSGLLVRPQLAPCRPVLATPLVASDM